MITGLLVAIGLVFEMGDGLQFEKVLDVLVVDAGLYHGVFAFAGADIVVEGGVCEAKVVLVALAS